jgi:hypothetical protein
MRPDQGNGAGAPHADYGITALVLQGGGALANTRFLERCSFFWSY